MEHPPVPTPPSRLTPGGEPAEEQAASTDRHPTDAPVPGPGRFLESIDMLRTMGRASGDLETIVEGARRERSMYRPGPIVDHLVDPEVFRPDAVAASGVTLRVAVVGLESGELRYVTEDGTLVDRDNRPLGDGPVDLVEAIRASCAIPMVFAPVRLGEENYVDGGVRESLPADIAIRHLGVGTCYAVVAGPSGLRREESYDDRDMLGILMRTTTAIMTDEVQRDEVVQARAAGAVVIEPEFDVHDTLTIEPGLVAIAMDYGYLRAAEAVLGASDEEQAVTRELVLLRRRIWHAEEDAFGEDTEESARLERVAEIAGLKYTLRDLLRRVPAERLPEGAEEWWRTWEHHRTEITVAPSWVPPPA
ncbi:patatin-like phospholipase family protein [Georgenia sp. Marseille-Q6866]